MKLPIVLLALAAPTFALAQTTPATPAKPKNLIYNGSFESFWQADNLWDGIDNDGYLAGARGGVNVISERGAVEDVAMPISVQLGDLNGDGLIDILTVDLEGYFRVYFNSGTKTEPKFTNCEIIPIFLSRFDQHKRRAALKASLHDLNRSGTLDLVLGDYAGEIMILKNSGSTTIPEFRQPPMADVLLVRTTVSGNLWGNVFAPAVWDWTRSGTPDLLVGEGSYSANAIHLLVNKGNGSAPKFTEDSRFYLAYGDGREQLVPAVVDYNGDGIPDLIVGDRKGTLNVYLSEGAWNKDKELKFSSTITCGSVSKFNGCIAPAVADLNGDGLFDLVIGKTNGRIAIAYNQGTKEQPKFATPVELKGTDVWKRNTMRNPSDWSADFGREKGNFYGYVTTVNETDDPQAAPIPDGKNVLKVGYFPSLNKIIKYTPTVFPASKEPEAASVSPPNELRKISPNWNAHQAPAAGYNTDSNMVIIRKFLDNSQVKPGVDYTFSFKSKGRSVKSARWYVAYAGHGVRTEARVKSRVGRGVQMERDEAWDSVTDQGDFTAGANWGAVSRNFNFKFAKEKDLNDPKTFRGTTAPIYRFGVEIRAVLNPGDGVFYLDDVQLIEKK